MRIVHANDFIAARHVERPEKQCVGDSKDGRIDSDPEREREQGNNCEAGGAKELAQGVADVGSERHNARQSVGAMSNRER